MKLRQRRISEHKASIKGQITVARGAKKKATKMILAEKPVSRGTVEAKSIQKVIHLWREKEEDEYTLLERRLAAWINALSEGESLFKKHVYENDDVTNLDLRQHRGCLYCALYTGEDLAVDFLFLNEPTKKDVTQKIIMFIDQKLDELRQTLHAWHGNLNDQTDIPQSFKDAIHELDRGELEPLDDILEGKTA
jgi:hypothetical protein